MKILLPTSLLTAAVLLTSPLLLSAPASADDTAVTMVVAAGDLTMTVPATATLDDGQAQAGGDTVSTSLGSVTITDERGEADASWVASTVSGAFTTGEESPAETIAAADVDYWSGPATASTGDGTFTPGQPTAGDAEAIDDAVEPVTAFGHAGGTGVNSATWSPTLVIAIAANKVAGTYAGTVTHSVL